MIQYTRNGEPFDINHIHIIDDVQYPVGWFYDADNRAAMGIDEVDVPDVIDLEALKSAAIAKCYTDVDSIYVDAVGNRTEEYKDAEVEARAFAAAGYTGTASDYVHGYTLHNPTGEVQTDQWAANQIIQRADAFANAKLAMRNQRFASQSAMRAATTPAELTSAVDVWSNFISNLRTQLGI
jgi:hypothetical protein